MSSEGWRTPSGWAVERWSDDTCWLTAPDGTRLPIEAFTPAVCACGEVVRPARIDAPGPYRWEHVKRDVTCDRPQPFDPDSASCWMRSQGVGACWEPE